MADETVTEDTSNLESGEQTELETTEEETTVESDDVEALKEQNRQLFARAKKAEGFTMTDGKWVKKPKTEVTAKPTASAVSPNDDVDARVNAVLEKRELESLDVSKDIKAKIATFAKVNGVSVKEAYNSEYIQFCKGQEDSKDNADRASLPTGRRGATKGPAPSISTIDPRTPEGQKALDKIHEENRKKLG